MITQASRIIGILLFSTSLNAWPDVSKVTGASLYLGLGQASIDRATSNIAEIDRTAFYGRIGADFKKGHWIYGVGLSWLDYSDRRTCNVLTASPAEDACFTSNASAGATSLYLETGYSHKLPNNLSMFILGGYELVLNSSRGIKDCFDCESMDIDIDSGGYLSPGFTYQLTDLILLSGNYYRYLSGDIENAFTITIGIGKI